ncbi:hypothetical protein THRCLA_04971 [Thraustotheca clavata]|uniref:VHS domain-containing protein n=1 Tax=Thraustotheca clavata TaxID=74557 RepID=A0A1V9ZXE1_9STRA|nr:hypothetical protein THRCLA_04971 [Thraustotheca clavata]
MDADAIRGLVTSICEGDASSPDWGRIMELCDTVSLGSNEAETTSRVLQQILGRRQSQDTVLLAFLATETILKNVQSFVEHVASRLFLQEIVGLVDDDSGMPEASSRALQLLQEWANEYTTYPVLRDTYQQLRLHGVHFPDATSEFEESKPLAASVKPALTQEFQKLRQDLATLEDKINTYRNAMSQGGGEEAEDVLDFLQQCQPRMNTLIEAGLAGKLDEQTLEICLTVNDNLIKVLEGDLSGEGESKPAAVPSYRMDDATPDYISGPFSNVSLSEQPPPAPAHHYNPDMV